ncbi:MAG: CHAP domain-containing protein [Alphaproteobacteria bacterium]|nr:CHAP domain-containing protein [Alphaproteobacteria bacterium]
MKKTIAFGLTGLALLAAAPALAQSTSDFGGSGRDASRASELAPYLQCVPYAREISGIRLYGDAHTWWQQAEGRYATGNAPKVGAVMAFRPHRNMQLGHVAAVSRVVDSRTVLLDHANWSPINGRRGQIERDVMAVDVSPANDWSAVRVWYHPLGGLGKTEWPVDGFIYSDRARSPVRIAQAPQGPVRMQSSRRFLSAFNEFSN